MSTFPTRLREPLAWAILLGTPTVLMFGWAIWEVPSFSALGASVTLPFCLKIGLGVFFSCFCWAIRALIEEKLAISTDERRKLIREELTGHLQPTEAIRLILAEHSESTNLARWLHKEIKTFERGRESLDADGRFRITTARLYEGIAGAIEDGIAAEVRVLDQDFRRWAEAYAETRNGVLQQSSSTFNYSKTILQNTKSSLGDREKKLSSFRRIFVIDETCEAFTGEDNKLATDEDWPFEEFTSATKAIVLVWGVEDLIKTETRNAEIETRYLKIADIENQSLVTSVKEAMDFVLLDEDLCFLEPVNYEDQKNPQTSTDRDSFICVKTKDKQFKQRSTDFNEFWERGKGLKDHSVYKKMIAHPKMKALAGRCL